MAIGIQQFGIGIEQQMAEHTGTPLEQGIRVGADQQLGIGMISPSTRQHQDEALRISQGSGYGLITGNLVNQQDTLFLAGQLLSQSPRQGPAGVSIIFGGAYFTPAAQKLTGSNHLAGRKPGGLL